MIIRRTTVISHRTYLNWIVSNNLSNSIGFQLKFFELSKNMEKHFILKFTLILLTLYRWIEVLFILRNKYSVGKSRQNEWNKI